MRALVLSTMIVASSVAGAAPPEPAGPHPRMVLDANLVKAWRAHAKLSAGPVHGAIRLCEEGTTTRRHDRAQYHGSAWAKLLQACLVAYAATPPGEARDAHAAGAIKFFEALLDDLDTVDDGRGGDAAAQRNSGYPLRNRGPYTALAYDWLHDHPRMTPALRAKARRRWKAWLDWYRDNGYRANSPGSNYHAGYLAAATLIAVAQAGEAGDDGAALWQHVADQMWGKEMANALSRNGILSGGNWPEGWQYGPLAVAEYALAARVIQRAGVEVPGVQPWLSSVLRNHVYSLSPSDGVYPGGDTEDETPTLRPHVLTLDAVALGDASPEDKAWARGELLRLRLVDRDFFLYDALAAVGDPPVAPPRAAWPTWYLAANTGTLYARTRWDEHGVWLVTECHAAIDTDHRHANAGTFALSRGKDDVIVDPSPYGSQSTLTTNAPTVVSAHFPPHYIPSQGSWGELVGYDFVTQRASGVVAARCDYADAYKFQHRRSDVPEAVRDFVLVPSTDGRDAALLVIDRARTDSRERAMYLGFRTPGLLVQHGETALATIGGTRLAISSVARSAGTATVARPSGKTCYVEGIAKGRCDAARLPTTDYRVRIPGPRPTAVHLISATAAKAPPATATPISGPGWEGVRIGGVRDATIIWRSLARSRSHTAGSGPFTYTADPGLHVILDAVDGATPTATRTPSGCKVTLAGKARAPVKPVVAMLDATCGIRLDPEAAAASAIGTKPRRVRGGSLRSGCCGAEAAPGQSIAMALIVLGLCVRRRSRARRD